MPWNWLADSKITESKLLNRWQCTATEHYTENKDIVCWLLRINFKSKNSNWNVVCSMTKNKNGWFSNWLFDNTIFTLGDWHVVQYYHLHIFQRYWLNIYKELGEHLCHNLILPQNFSSKWISIERGERERERKKMGEKGMQRMRRRINWKWENMQAKRK